ESKGPGTRIQPKKVEAVAAFLADDLPGDERNVLVTVWPLAEDPFTRIIIVLGLLRQALGTGQTPSNQVLLGLALFLTAMVMMPTWDKAW
ncbi:hypothetical protein ABGA94_00995, partial [Stenotrophomonas sp. 3diitr2024]